MLKVGIYGASGRIGTLLVREILNSEKFHLSSVFVRNELQYSLPSSTMITKELKVFLESCDVIIDFSSAEATTALLESAQNTPTPLVIGTTGLDSNAFKLLESVATKAPILYATNMSKGVAMLDTLATLTAKTLQHSDVEIVELHHHHKKDAPSGTALSLAQNIAKARNLNLDNVKITGREGNLGARSENEIAIMSLRGGDVAGRHTIGFYMDGEYLELTHNATSRLTFAKGALDAATFIVKQKNGLYSIQDALRL